MIQAGVLTDDDPVELLEGVLAFKMPKNPSHRFVTQKVQETIRAVLPAGWWYQAQEPVTLGDGEPEPDGAIVRGSLNEYRDRHPGPGDAALIIEVADTTLSRDRGIKLRSYARAGIPVYWIINLVERRIEIYTTPDRHETDPTYHDCQVYGISDMIPVVLDGASIGSVAAADLLP
jgi:Uma2 family endonuclease